MARIKRLHETRLTSDQSALVDRIVAAARGRQRVVGSLRFFGNAYDDIIVKALLRGFRSIPGFGGDATVQTEDGVIRVWTRASDATAGQGAEFGEPFVPPPVKRKKEERRLPTGSQSPLSGLGFLILTDEGLLLGGSTHATPEDRGRFLNGDSAVTPADRAGFINGADTALADYNAGLLMSSQAMTCAHNAGILSLLDTATLGFNSGLLSYESRATLYAREGGFLGGHATAQASSTEGAEDGGLITGSDLATPAGRGCFLGGSPLVTLGFGPHETYGWIYQDTTPGVDFFPCGDLECQAPGWIEDVATAQIIGTAPPWNEGEVHPPYWYHSATHSLMLNGNNARAHIDLSGFEIGAQYNMTFWAWCINQSSHPIIVTVHDGATALRLHFPPRSVEPLGNLAYYAEMNLGEGGVNLWTAQAFTFTATNTTLRLAISSAAFFQIYRRFVDDFAVTKI